MKIDNKEVVEVKRIAFYLFAWVSSIIFLCFIPVGLGLGLYLLGAEVFAEQSLLFALSVLVLMFWSLLLGACFLYYIVKSSKPLWSFLFNSLVFLPISRLLDYYLPFIDPIFLLLIGTFLVAHLCVCDCDAVLTERRQKAEEEEKKLIATFT